MNTKSLLHNALDSSLRWNDYVLPMCHSYKWFFANQKILILGFVNTLQRPEDVFPGKA
jgi:hypothetical protein